MPIPLIMVKSNVLRPSNVVSVPNIPQQKAQILKSFLFMKLLCRNDEANLTDSQDATGILFGMIHSIGVVSVVSEPGPDRYSQFPRRNAFNNGHPSLSAVPSGSAYQLNCVGKEASYGASDANRGRQITDTAT